jgi:4-amino-4-deoxy-L-arabinose transferase-like glycosyltransferase
MSQLCGKFQIKGSAVRNDVIAAAIICGVCVMLYLRLPRHGDIWWMDASRHALNGVFVLDFVRAMPLRHPMDFAIDYYRQWPALTIGFYPPLFYVVLAASYAIFGVSEASALIPELAFLALLGWGAYRLSRHWLGAAPALAAALMLMGAPEVSYWAQQIMLDVPSYALLIWAVEFQLRFMKGGSQRSLYAAVVCAALAIALKYNAAFIVAVMVVALLHARGWRFALDRVALRAAALGIVLILPVLVIFLKFSTYDLEQAASIHGALSRWSLRGLTYYASIFGTVVSWPTLALATIYCVAVPFVRRLRLQKDDAVFLLSWVILGYIFYAMIAVKEPRHIMFITYPVVLAAVLLLERMLGRFAWRSVAPLALACGVFAFSLTTRPAPYVTGMRQAALDVARLAPPETNVAFWGRLDGTFIYAMRADTNRMDLGVIRIDKLLLGDVAVALDLGFSEKDWDAKQIVEQLRRLHVQYVVMQTRYEDEIGVIHRLGEALQSDEFQEVEHIPMTSNYPFPYVTELVIYRATAEVPRGRIAPPIALKIINKAF